MQNKLHRLFCIVVMPLLVFCVLLAWMPPLALAQAPAPPELRITKVDVARYPEVRVFVSAAHFPNSLDTIPLTVLQDGVTQEVTASDIVDVGTQTVLLLDASGNIAEPGLTGQPRYQEVSSIIRRVVERQVLSPQYDWLAAYAPTTDQGIQAIKEWTGDHGDLYNSLYQYAPDANVGETPLFELIYFALDSFDDPKLDASAQRTIILFSDGIDTVSGVKIDDAIARAREFKVRINTVMLGPSTQATQGNLERIAIMTGGQYIPLTTPEALDGLWDALAGSRAQRALTYRSTTPQPKQVIVSAALAQGSTQASLAFPVVPALPPVEIQIIQPTSGQEIVRHGDFYTSSLETLLPASLPLQVTFTWPNNAPRTLQRVEYTLGSDTRVVESEPFDKINFPIEALNQGAYAVRVQAIDELGIAGTSKPLSIRIKTDLPAAAAATAALCTGLLCPDNMRWLTLASLGLALAALAFAIFVFLRKPAVLATVTQGLSGTIKAVTQPFSLDRRMKGTQVSRARLVLVEGGANLPQTIEITGSNMRLGRDAGLSNVVLEDPRVSRYHCRISEEGDDIFRIFDEGSTSGTYVNYKAVDIRGQILQNGDLIHVGPVGLRFELLGATQNEDLTVATEPHTPTFGGDPDDDPFRTEPFKLSTPQRKDPS